MEQKQRPPEIGAEAPDFELPVAGRRETFRLSEAVARGPLVLIFYRGFW